MENKEIIKHNEAAKIFQFVIPKLYPTLKKLEGKKITNIGGCVNPVAILRNALNSIQEELKKDSYLKTIKPKISLTTDVNSVNYIIQVEAVYQTTKGSKKLNARITFGSKKQFDNKMQSLYLLEDIQNQEVYNFILKEINPELEKFFDKVEEKWSSLNEDEKMTLMTKYTFLK